MSQGGRPVCEYCGDVLGVYEPIIVLSDRRETSIAREPELFEHCEDCYHRACFAPAAPNDTRRDVRAGAR